MAVKIETGSAFSIADDFLASVPEGVVTFSRLTLDADDTPSFESSTATFNKVLLLQDGTIEDCTGALQVS